MARCGPWIPLDRLAALLAIWLLAVLAGAQQGRAGVTGLETGTAAADAADQAIEDALATRLESLANHPALGAASGTGRRLALVIGNDAYGSLPRLTRSVSDAARVATIFTELGFQVTSAQDADLDRFDDLLDKFYATLKPGDIAAFFYAGHGMAEGEVNYLIPTDMPQVDAGENPRLSRRAIDAGAIVDSILARGADLAFVVLDACREDPFPKGDTRAGVKLGGLSRMEPARGAFVIYSAGLGQTALDRLGPSDADPNSVFTRKFGPILETPGMPLAEIAKRTQIEVGALARTVNHTQAPAYYDQVVGNVVFTAPRPRLLGLTIGVDEYAGTRQLQGAVNDAALIAEVLTEEGAEQVVEIYDRDARFAYIDFAWRKLVEDARPGDTIVFAYAGASGQMPEAEPGSEADGADEYLALADFQWVYLEQPDEPPPIDAILTDDELTAMMELAAAKNLNVVLLVDGCHGGGLLDREFANISFLGATEEGEVAYEYSIDGAQHGAMSYVFAEALAGLADVNVDGKVSQAELIDYVGLGVFQIVGQTQHPQFFPAPEDASPSLALVEIQN